MARVELTLPEHTHVGAEVEVRAWICTGTLAASDVVPQVYLGKVHEGRDIVDPEIVPMENQGASDGGHLLFRALIPCRTSGSHGLSVRVLPCHVDLGHPHETGLITWAVPGGPDAPDPSAWPTTSARAG